MPEAPPSEPQPTWAEKITWKHLAIGLTITIILYPQPFMRVLKPLFQHFRHNYQKSKIKPHVSKLILTSDRRLTVRRLTKNHLLDEDEEIRTIDKFEGREDETVLELWAENIMMQVKMWELEADHKGCRDMTGIIRADEVLLRKLQLKILNLPPSQIYKIRSLNQHQVYVLQKNQNLDSFSQQIIQLDF